MRVPADKLKVFRVRAIWMVADVIFVVRFSYLYTQHKWQVLVTLVVGVAVGDVAVGQFQFLMVRLKGPSTLHILCR